MFYSNWMLEIATNERKEAEAILQNALSNMRARANFKNFVLNNEHGNLIIFEIKHDTDDWANFIYEILSLADTIGFEWTIMGEINRSPFASTEHTNVRGVKSLKWLVNVDGESEYA